MLLFYSIFQAIIKSQPQDKRSGVPATNVLQVQGRSYSVLSAEDALYLPIFNGEVAVHKVDGGKS